jgi:uncharacterized protein
VTIDATGTDVVAGRAGRWMRTFTGRQFWPRDPRAEDVCIEDIAHALALTNRFGGHTSEPYSVAQHSVHVAALVERALPGLALYALLHDAAEAYVGDSIRAIKPFLVVEDDETREGFWSVELRVQAAILAALGVETPNTSFDAHSVIVKAADNVALATEARDLMGDPCWPGLPEPDEARIEVLDWRAAERSFLAAYQRLRGEAARG